MATAYPIVATGRVTIRIATDKLLPAIRAPTRRAGSLPASKQFGPCAALSQPHPMCGAEQTPTQATSTIPFMLESPGPFVCRSFL